MEATSLRILSTIILLIKLLYYSYHLLLLLMQALVLSLELLDLCIGLNDFITKLIY